MDDLKDSVKEGVEIERDIGGGEEEKGEEIKKRGRPTNLERLFRERTKSMNSIEEMLLRDKRKEWEQDGEEVEVGEEEEIFKRSRITKRSPEKTGVTGGGGFRESVEIHKV